MQGTPSTEPKPLYQILISWHFYSSLIILLISFNFQKKRVEPDTFTYFNMNWINVSFVERISNLFIVKSLD